MLRVGRASAGARAASARRPPSLLLAASALTTPPPPTLCPARRRVRRRRRDSAAAAAAAPSSSSSSSDGASSSSSSSSSSAAGREGAAAAAAAAAAPSSSAATTTGVATAVAAAPPPATASSSHSNGPLLIHESLAARPRLCDGGLPDPEMCLLDDDDPEMIAEDLVMSGAAAAPLATAAATEQPQQQQQQQQQLPLPSPLHVAPAPDGSVLDEAASRGRWLVGLLVVQSLSSVVLERFEPLIRDHLTITLFLTMLVGAGGNAGNQSAIKVVRSLATGQLDASWGSARAALVRQAGVAVVLGGGLAAAGFVRVLVSAAIGGLGGGEEGAAAGVSWADASRDAAAIAVSLLCIVLASTLLGTALPFLLARCGLDPAHSGTTIQVASDVLGVLVTCVACSAFYSGALDGWVVGGLGAALEWAF